MDAVASAWLSFSELTSTNYMYIYTRVPIIYYADAM